VHRLDPGVIPFRKAVECRIHVSGGEFNVAANLADCFGLRTAIVTAMADYPIGDLIAERVRRDGRQAVLQALRARWRHRPNMATVFSDRGLGARAPVVFYNRCNEAAGRLKRAISTGARFFRAACAGFILAASSPPFPPPPRRL